MGAMAGADSAAVDSSFVATPIDSTLAPIDDSFTWFGFDKSVRPYLRMSLESNKVRYGWMDIDDSPLGSRITDKRLEMPQTCCISSGPGNSWCEWYH